MQEKRIKKGHKPGKEFKGILFKAFEAQLDREFDSLEGAVEWLKANYGLRKLNIIFLYCLKSIML